MTQRPSTLLKRKIAATGLTQQQFADHIGVNRISVNQLLNDRRAITPVMALRISRALGGQPGLWLALQANWDLQQATRDYGKEVGKITRLPCDVP